MGWLVRVPSLLVELPALGERLCRERRSQLLEVRDTEAALQQNKGMNVADICMVIVLGRDELDLTGEPASFSEAVFEAAHCLLSQLPQIEILKRILPARIGC